MLAPAAFACGTERWAQKTLTDAAAKQIDWRVQPTTIAALTAVPNTRPRARAPFETHVYRVQATITDDKIEADGDIHLVLSDGQQTMIAESPAVACTRGAQHRYQMAVARRALEARLHPTGSWQKPNLTVVLTGVGFLDRSHGQRGLAPNAVELHPVTRVRWLTG